MARFEQVEPKVNSPMLEQKVLEYWKRNKIFEKVNKKGKGREEKVHYDGPITVNNAPHYGHAITWTLKDVVPRFWTMLGYFVSRNIGWDCQGIPVEYEVEKRQGFKHKDDIEKFGVAEFNNLCRESVLEYVDTMTSYETRIGRWIDKNDEYSTMEKDYIESLWWSFKELYQKGLLYEGHKVVAYSTRAGTTLSNAEVALGGYKEMVDPGITVKFKVSNAENKYFLAWTTTPWTIPGNLMLAVGENIEYVEVQVDEEIYILAKDCVERVFAGKEYRLVKEVSSKEIVKLEYIPPFNYFLGKEKEGVFKVIYGDHVNTEEGTGVVHLAPYGMEDFEIFMEKGITLFDYLDDTAHFTDLVPAYKGLFYKDANKKIIKDLKEKGLLFKLEEYAHQMPVCWRTDTPLIYKPVKSWYLSVAKIKGKLLKENDNITWVPGHARKGRFGGWLENARDWALSRNRYWGTPIPVWVNDKTGEIVVVGSFQELEQLSGKKLNARFDPHRPFVDEITWKGKTDGTFRRVNDVLDVWYDSGAMPFARYHYPFENKELVERRFPADYIAESVDQTRGWFYTMLVINVALFGKTPYRAVAMSGMLLGSDGQKLSKSKKNYPPMDDEVFDNFGADVLRYFFLSSPVVRGESVRFSNEALEEVQKELFTTLWNSYRYFLTYANIGDLSATSTPKSANPLDMWILIRFKQLVCEVQKNMEEYELMYASRQISPFVNDLSVWYIRRSRDRLSSGDSAALGTLYYVLVNLSKAMAPFTPFIAESMYQNLVSNVDKKAPESVHMANYPVAEDITSQEEKILRDMRFVREVTSLGHFIRQTVNIPVKQPLSELKVKAWDGSKDFEETLWELVKDELNVKKVSVVDKISDAGSWRARMEGSVSVALNTKVTNDLALEGQLRNLIRSVQQMRKKEGLNVGDKINLKYPKEWSEVVGKFEKEIKDKANVENLVEGAELKLV